MGEQHAMQQMIKRIRNALLLTAVTALLAGCSTSSEPGHTFEVVEEAGIPVAVSSAMPRIEGELFDYERILAIRPDPGNKETLLYRPSSFTVGDDGLYYVADSGNHRVVVFDGEGRFVHAFGREGGGPGELQDPILVEVSNGIVSVFGERTSRFRCDGTFIDVLGGGRSVRTAADGSIVVEDTTRRTGEDGSSTIGALARVFDDTGIVAAEVESGQAPSSGWMQYKGAPSVFLLPGNEILATSGVDPTVDYFGLDGNLKRRVRLELPPQPVTEADRAAVDEVWSHFIEEHEATRGSSAVDHFLEMKSWTSYPVLKAFWGRPIVEDGGWVWLPFPVPRLGVSTPGAAPIATAARFRIVDSRGEFIGTTEWPREAVEQSGARIINGHLLAMVWDDETEEMVPTVYRIRPRVEGLVYP